MIAAHVTSASRLLIRVWAQNDVIVIRDVTLAIDRSGLRPSDPPGLVGTLARTHRFPADLAVALSAAGIGSPMCLFGNLDPDVYESEADSRERIDSLMASVPYAVALAVTAALGRDKGEPLMAVGLLAVIGGRSHRAAAGLAGVSHGSLGTFVRRFDVLLRSACRGERPGTASRVLEAMAGVSEEQLVRLASMLRDTHLHPKTPDADRGLALEHSPLAVRQV